MMITVHQLDSYKYKSPNSDILCEILMLYKFLYKYNSFFAIPSTIANKDYLTKGKSG